MIEMTQRTPQGKFVKGQSGNPGGRPKLLSEVQELARAHTAENLEGLMEIARNPKSPAQARVAARVAVLDRAWGKPGQSIDMNMNPKDELDEMLETLNGKTRGIPGAAKPVQ
jgi:hypothetical protein